MSKRGAPGLKIQIGKALKVLNGIGKSKKEEKKKYREVQKLEGKGVNPLSSPLIHSFKHRENIIQTSVLYLRWCRENGYGAKLIKDFNHAEGGKAWIEHRISEGIRNVPTEIGHLRKLADGIEKTWGVEAAIVPVDIKKMLSESGSYYGTKQEKIARQSKGYRKYTKQEVKQGLNYLDETDREKSADALEGQVKLGFRVREAVSLLVGDIDLKKRIATVTVQRGQKGTLKREFPIPEDYIPKLKSLIKGKKNENRVFDVTGKNVESRIRNMQRYWKEACQSMGISETKTHNLRAYYASEGRDELIEAFKESLVDIPEDKKEDAARRMAEEIIIREIGHRDRSKLAHYIRS